MKEIVLQPSFYNKFECIGGACKNNCCHDWEIVFTKEEFRNVKRKMITEEFKETFKNAFNIQKGNDNYTIKLHENGKCKFLDECGLCNMYKEIGHENMSLTCKVFPRFCTYYIDRYECFLSIGCEEVVRLLLQEKDGIQLDVVEREMTTTEKEASPTINKQQKNVIAYCWNDLKMLIVAVLQNREYTFGERMAVLGLAMKKINEMINKNEFIKIQKYVDDFITDFYDEKNREVYNKIFQNINKDGSIRAINTLNCFFAKVDKNLNKIDKKITIRIVLQRKLIMEAMQITKINILYDAEKYQQAIKDFEEFIKGKEWWIENIMIEGFLAVRMPFFIDGDIWKNYCAMAILYSTMLFIWTCCMEKDSTEEEFAVYTSTVARNLFHNKIYINDLEKHLDATESNTLAHMALLLL